MKKIASIDFETFYIKKSYSVQETGSYRYTHDERFDPYLVSIVTSEGDSYVGDPREFDFRCIASPEWEWVSHNARFDMDVYIGLQDLYPFGYPMPEVWNCTSDLCSYLQIPRSLEKAVHTLYKKQLKKTVRDNMSGRRFSELTQFDKEALLEYAAEDARWCLKIFQDFGKHWPDDERVTSIINRTIGQNGVFIDIPYVKQSILCLDAVTEEAASKIPWVSRGEKPLSLNSAKKESLNLGIEPPKSMAKTSEDFEDWLEKYGEKVEWAREVGKYRSANMLCQKAKTILDRIQPDETLELHWLYFGAHTGRFSGSEGFNSQNLPRGEIFGVDLRKAIVPPKDHVIITCDASNIEFRTLMYWAKDEHMLNLLRQGYNPYEAVATMCGGWEGEMGTLKKTDPQKYATFKAISLGCGFGMGPDRFMYTAKVLTGGMYKPNLEQATENVKSFRSNMEATTNLWRSLNNKIKEAALEDKPTLKIPLPSGRCLIYREIGSDGNEYTASTIRKGNFARTKIYGGLLAENLSQALARDIFVYHLREAVYAGLRVCMHTHDEMVIYSHKDKADEDRITLEKIMRTPPEWIGIPLEVESEICSHYKK